MRAQRHAMVDAQAHATQILGDVVRARAAEIVLRPLAEGLALFAEFEIVPGRGRVLSRTSVAATICFGMPVPEGKYGSYTPAELSLVALLQGTRRRPDFLKRKTGVYAMPYEYVHGYLPGYLSVKALWAALAARADALDDKDSFLAFLRSWIYDDPVLAMAIVSEDADDPTWPIRKIGQRVYDRFARLINAPDLSAIVEQWMTAVEAGAPVHTVLGSSQAEVDQASKSIFALIDRDRQDEGLLGKLANHALTTQTERKYVVLGSLQSVVTCQKGKFHIEAADATFAQGEPPMPDGRFEGEVHIVMPSRSNCLLICLAATDGEVYLLKSYGDTSDLEPTEVTGHILNRKSNESIHELLAKTLKQLPGVGDAAAFVTKNRTTLCDQIYAKLVTLHTEEASIASVLDLLRKKGLLSVVDGDHAMLRAVAAIGLANTSGSDDVSLLFFAKYLELEDGLLETAIRTASERHGMRLLLPGTQYGGATALV
ncbi:hypothetical protein [Rhizobium leguminosarum]|uniref:hypothetical protein n=1 Tax=Rhizobium leguminosarum TaxID=384 RepID=UPI001F2CD664|nr:hypothetical protein [Rhizobium leguminosarum]UIJ82204.1 hypothetical protein LZK78_25165 [Rhizobium leguminosarum]